MNSLILAITATLLLASCVEAGPNFERMSEAELAEYNSGRSLSQMIVCSEISREFSRVRRRNCSTIEQMYGSVEQAEKLGVLNMAVGAGSGGTF